MRKKRILILLLSLVMLLQLLVPAGYATETEENATDEGETDNADETTEDTTEASTEDTAEDPAETERGRREAGWYSAEVQDKARSMVRGFDMMHPDTRARILEMIASGKNVDKKTLAALANVMAANFTLHVKFRNDMPTGGFRYRSDNGATMILLSTKATAEVLDHVVLEEVWHGVQGTKLAKDAETLLKRIAGEDAVAAEAKKYRDEFVKHFGEDAANKQLTEDALMDEAYANLFAKYGKEAQFLSRFARIAKGRFARVFGRIADLARTQKAKSELSYRQLMKLYRAYRKAVFSAGIYDIAAIRAVMQRMGDDEEEKENASDTGEANVANSVYLSKLDDSLAMQLQDWLDNGGKKGKSYNGSYFTLGKTPRVLLDHGAQNSDLIMYEEVVAKVTGMKGDNAHTISTDEIAKLPSQLSDPVLLFTGSVPNSFVALTEIVDKQGNEVVVAVHINRHSESRSKITKIASLYSKTNDFGENRIIARSSSNPGRSPS